MEGRKDREKKERKGNETKGNERKGTQRKERRVLRKEGRKEGHL